MTIACTLTDVDRTTRRERWLRLRECGSGSAVETPTGLRLTFRSSPSVDEELRALAKLERECCAFATWTVRQEGADVLLDIDSEGKGVAALHGMFEPFPRKA